MNNINNLPLAVDLDGSLIKTDLLWESFIQFIKLYPWKICLIFTWLLKGKANLKHQLAQAVNLDIASLPYNNELVEWLKNEKQKGRKIVLATASNRKYAKEIINHCPFFDKYYASDERTNLSKHNKVKVLTKNYGSKAFDYVGNSYDDIPVWESCNNAILVDTSAPLRKQAELVSHVQQEFSTQQNYALTIIKAMRAYQWVKNLLVFIPIIAAHQFFDLGSLIASVQVFFCFCMAASSGYLFNDLLDVQEDRNHHSKHKRPLASGAMPMAHGALLCLFLLVLALGAGFLFSFNIFLVTLVYYISTISYSLILKSKAIIDVIFLAGLYTLRIIAGSMAAGIKLSFWLVILSMFTFLSLAFIKRYSEIEKLATKKMSTTKARGYFTSDSVIIAILGVASGYQSVMVLALYLNTESVNELYSTPYLLWLACPVYLYWISRMLMVTARGEMHDDPIVFALKDRNCILAIAALIALMAAAI